MQGIPFLIRVDPWLVRVLINRLLGVPPFNECIRPLVNSFLPLVPWILA
jgi:hypothetical protein